MYLNIILTLIFLLFAGNLWANLTYGLRQEAREKEILNRREESNDYMVMLP